MSSRIVPLIAVAALWWAPVTAAQGFFGDAVDDAWSELAPYVPPPEPHEERAPAPADEPESPHASEPPPPPPADEPAPPPAPEERHQSGPSPGVLGALADALPAPMPPLAPLAPIPLPTVLPLPEYLPLPEPSAPAAAPGRSSVSAATVAPVSIETGEAGPAEVAVALVAMGAGASAAASGAWSWTRLRRVALAAALYTRLAKERLLDHDARGRLLAAIREQPGRAVADLAERTEIPRNTASYHLRVMERERLVASQRNGRTRMFFAPGTAEARVQGDALAALRHDTSRAMAVEIGAAPGVDQKALCARLGLSPSLAHWHADRLVASGLVDKRREGRFVRYYPGASYALVARGA